MSTTWNHAAAFASAEALEATSEDLLVATCLAAAAQGDVSAYYDLGVAYSTGSHGVDCDLIEAHKWFNLAAASGHSEAALCRADISDEMTRPRNRRSPAPRPRMAFGHGPQGRLSATPS
jgi:hypothetical protein